MLLHCEVHSLDEATHTTATRGQGHWVGVRVFMLRLRWCNPTHKHHSGVHALTHTSQTTDGEPVPATRQYTNV